MKSFFWKAKKRLYCRDAVVARVISFCLVVSICSFSFMPISLQAEDGDVYVNNGIWYEKNDFCASVVGHDGNWSADAVIEVSQVKDDKVEFTRDVDKIADNVFQGVACGAVYVKSWNTDMQIGKKAFADMHVGYVQVSSIANMSKVTIGESAFENTTVYGAGITIGGRIDRIESNAFKNVYSQGFFRVYADVDTIEPYAFAGTEIGQYKEISFDTVRCIEEKAFADSKMGWISLPDGVESIGSNIFLGCNNLSLFTLPKTNTVKEVAEDAFLTPKEVTCFISDELTDISQYHLENYDNINIVLCGEWEWNSDVVQYILEHQLKYSVASNGKMIMPEETVTPETTTSPAVTIEPTAAVSPTAPIEPTVAVSPEVTVEPTATALPEATVESTATASPEATVEPTATASPEATVKPTATTSPEATVEPTATVSPTASVYPMATVSPTVTNMSSEKITVTSDPEKDSGNGSLSENIKEANKEKETAFSEKIFVFKGNKYRLLGKNSVSFAGVRNSNKKKLVIHDKVLYQGKTYQVTKIESKALFKSKKIKKVVIGNQVKKIGNQAFARCSRLEEIRFGENVIQLGRKVLFKDSKLKKITFRGTKVKKIGKNSFSGVPRKTAIVVPKRKIKKYLKIINEAD